VDDDQFEDTVPVDVGRDRAGPEAVRLGGGRSEVDATPARVVTALSDASEEPVLLSRGVEEQLLAAVVVEVGGHDGPDAPGVAECGRCRVDEPATGGSAEEAVRPVLVTDYEREPTALVDEGGPRVSPAGSESAAPLSARS